MLSRKITIAGTGYAGLSSGVLLLLHNQAQNSDGLLLSPLIFELVA